MTESARIVFFALDALSEAPTAAEAAASHSKHDVHRGRDPEGKIVEGRMAIVNTVRVFIIKFMVDTIDPNIA